MARPLRIEYPDAFYHVMNRGASRKNIYLIDDDYHVFLETLKETANFFDLRIVSYCLMPNHYHLLIQTPKANLARAMRHLNGVYTQRFNRIHKKDGALFRGRYKAILVQEDEYLTHLIRYIHLNPLAANLVQDLSQFPWVSHHQYLKAKDEEPWLHVRLGLAFFSNKTSQALKAYRSFISQGVDPKTQAFYSKKHTEPILGDPDFLKHIKEKYIYGREGLSSEVPEARKLAGSEAVKRILGEVSAAYKKHPDKLLASKRGEAHLERLMALSLCREFSGLTLSEVATHFKINSYKTVNSSCQRFKKYISKDEQARHKYSKIQLRCVQGEI